MKKILIVDDQTEVREILSEFLSFKGYNVIEASNGKTALKEYQAHSPLAAIVDVEMPVMNGLQFSKRVLAENKDFPIIIVTAFVEKYSMKDFDDIGV